MRRFHFPQRSERTPCRRLTMVAAVLALLAGAAPPALAQQDWSPGRPLDLLPKGQVLQFAALAPLPQLTFFSNVFPSDVEAPLPLPPAVFVVNAQRAPLPPGDFTFMFPQLAVGPDSVIHVLWGEPARSQRPHLSPQWLSARPAALWYARYARRRWSTPELVWAGRQVFLNYGRHLTVDRRGRVHFALAATDSLAFLPAVLHGVRTGQRWAIAELKELDSPSLAISADSASDTVYVAGVHTGPGKAAALRLVRLDGSGEPAPALDVMHDLDYQPADLRLLLARGRIRVLWTRSRGAAFEGKEVLSAGSTPGGRWTATPPERVAGILLSLNAVASGCGADLAIVGELVPPDRATLTELVFSGEEVRRRPILRDYYAAANPALARSGGRTTLLWMGVRQPESEATVLLARRSGCP